MTLTLAAQDYRVLSSETITDSGDTSQTTVRYGQYHGVPVIDEARIEAARARQRPQRGAFQGKQSQLRAGPPETNFSADSLLGGAGVRHLPPEPEPLDPPVGHGRLPYPHRAGTVIAGRRSGLDALAASVERLSDEASSNQGELALG